MGRFREAQGFAGAQGTDIAAVATNGIDAINTQSKDGSELLAAQIAVGLIVPENESIGAQTILEGFQQESILLLAAIWLRRGSCSASSEPAPDAGAAGR